MRIVIFGAGAVGSLFGARLAREGTDVLLVGRSAPMAAIRDHGLTVEGVQPGTFHLNAVDRLPPGANADGVLLTVKAYDLPEAAQRVASGLPGPFPILALQNGLGIESALAHALADAGWIRPTDWIVRGLNSVPATWVAPGRVRQAGEGEVVLADVGEGQHAGMFVTLLSEAGIPARQSSEVAREVWRKALVNAAINPVTADHGVPNGQLLQEPWRGQALALLREALTAARAEGFEFTEEEAEQELWRVVKATANNRSSMLQDLEAGRRTEVEAISGAILEHGRHHNLPMPATERITGRIHDKERHRAGPHGGRS